MFLLIIYLKVLIYLNLSHVIVCDFHKVYFLTFISEVEASNFRVFSLFLPNFTKLPNYLLTCQVNDEHWRH